MITKRPSNGHDGFTLIEMLLVLFVLTILILVFVPNLNTQREKINERQNDAFEQVVVNQIELYAINETAELENFGQLQTNGYLTKKQTEKAVKLWTNLAGFNERP